MHNNMYQGININCGSRFKETIYVNRKDVKNANSLINKYLIKNTYNETIHFGEFINNLHGFLQINGIDICDNKNILNIRM